MWVSGGSHLHHPRWTVDRSAWPRLRCSRQRPAPDWCSAPPRARPHLGPAAFSPRPAACWLQPTARSTAPRPRRAIGLPFNLQVNAQNNNGQTAYHMAITYELDEVKAILEAFGADPEVQNFDNHPAKFGLDGDMDPKDPINMLVGAESTAAAMAALDAAMASLSAGGDIDKGKFAMTGMQTKKGMKKLAKADWSEACADKFKAVMQKL